MIDVHSHILPNIDDGSRSIDETFNLIKEYNSGEMPLYHMDVYRLENNCETIGFNDYFNKDAVCIIEWSDMICDCLPEERLQIKFKIIDENTRILILEPFGRKYEDLVNSVLWIYFFFFAILS